MRIKALLIASIFLITAPLASSVTLVSVMGDLKLKTMGSVLNTLILYEAIVR